MRTELSPDRKILTIVIPMKFEKRGARKLLIAPPGGTAWVPSQPNFDQDLIRALVLGHKWRKMLDSGEVGSILEIADNENLHRSFVGRRLDMTLLAPDIVKAGMCQ